MTKLRKSPSRRPAAPVDPLNAAFERIRKVQKRKNKTVLDHINCLSELGDELAKLKQIARENNLKGSWTVRLHDELGLDAASISRLVKIASSGISRQLSTFGQELVSRLTVDPQKLATFVEIPENQRKEALQRINLQELNRDSVRHEVRRFLAGDRSESPEAPRPRRSPVRILTKTCDVFTDEFTKQLIAELKSSKVAERKEAGDRIRKTLAKLNELLTACETNR